jgi:hypothetical protein
MTGVMLAIIMTAVIVDKPGGDRRRGEVGQPWTWVSSVSV